MIWTLRMLLLLHFQADPRMRTIWIAGAIVNSLLCFAILFVTAANWSVTSRKEKLTGIALFFTA